MVGESHGYVHFQKASVQAEAFLEASAVLEAPAAVLEAPAAVLEARVGWDVDASFIKIPFTPPVPLLNVSRAFSRMVHRVRSFRRFFSHPGVGSPLFHCFCPCFCPRCVLYCCSLVPSCVCVTCPNNPPYITSIYLLDILPYYCQCRHPRYPLQLPRVPPSPNPSPNSSTAVHYASPTSPKTSRCAR